MSIPFSPEKCRPDTDSSYMGWICSYTPEELILAAGYTPYKLDTDSSIPSHSEAFLPPNFCPYVRRLFNKGYLGGFDKLAGIIFVYSCDSLRRLADIWSEYLRPKFLYRLEVPRKMDSLAEDFFTVKLKAFKKALEEEIRDHIQKEDILEAINTVNHTRELLKQISQFRQLPNPPLTGKEFYSLTEYSKTANKSKFNLQAENVLQYLTDHVTTINKKSRDKIRILLCGCLIEDLDFYELIEQEDILIVADDLCNSSKYFDKLVDTNIEPLRGIARRYLRRAPCARMQNSKYRITRLIDTFKENNCDGIIYHTLKFCDLVQSDLPALSRFGHQENIPVLHLERESLTENLGQTKTRIQAFTEMLKNRKSAFSYEK